MENIKREHISLTQVSNRKIGLKERIKIIIREYKNCESVEVEIAEDLVLANVECDSNLYEEDSTEQIKKFYEKVYIRVQKKGCRVLEP